MESEYGFVAMTNELLQRFQLPVITDLGECTSQMFVTLYEGILGEKHPHIVSVRNKQDELTNIQITIDTLARDVLHADLSHISGEAIIDRDHVTIRYLLEIFIGLMEYVMEQITSGESTEVEDEQSAIDPDVLTQGTISTISDILQEELGTRDHSYGTRSRNKTRSVQKVKQNDVSLPSTISNVESLYDSEYSSDSTIELPHHALARNTVAILPQDALTISGSQLPSRNVGELMRAAEESSTGQKTGLPSRSTGKLSRTTGQPSSTTKPAPRTTWSPSKTGPPSTAGLRSTESQSRLLKAHEMPFGAYSKAPESDVPSRDIESPSRSLESEESQGEKIKQRVLENESIEKLRVIETLRSTGTDISSTKDLFKRSSDHGNLQVEEVSSSLSSPPSATKHRPKPSGMRSEENAFASLGVRPKPASHPHFRREHQDGRLRKTEGDTTVRHHLHTHHHYHVSDDHQPTEKQTNAGGRNQKIAHTLSHPPSDDDDEEDQLAASRVGKLRETRRDRPTPGHNRLSNIHSSSDVYSDIERPGTSEAASSTLHRHRDVGLDKHRHSRYIAHEDVSSSLGQSMPLPHNTIDGMYNLRSRQKGVPSAKRTTTTSSPRKVAFDGHDEFDDENELIDNEEFESDKNYILNQLKKRLVDKKAVKRIAGDLSEDSDSDISLHSDSIVDYDPTPRVKRHRVYSPKRENKPKSSVVKPVLKKNHVHFDDALDIEAKGQFSKIRRSIREEGSGHERKTKAMKDVYAKHLDQLQSGQKELIDKKKKASELLDKKYRKIHQIPKMKRYTAANKYTTSSVVTNRERSKVKGPVGKRKRSASSSPVLVRNRRPLVIEDDEMLPTVMSEFPMLHVSPHTAHNMWSRQMRQLEQLTKSGFNQSRKTKTQRKMEEAEKRQELLLSIMRKELAHNRRMKDIKEKREHEKAMKAKIQEQRQTTARARRYYDQFKGRSSARMLKRKNREEQIFKKLFEDGLQIQKNRIRELRKYAKEKREEMAEQQQNEIESLENYYSNQFAMLAEAIGQERHDLVVRDNAQAKVMAKMKRELRRKMETEIKEFQENLYNDEDREYFRQVEADRMKRELQLAAYKTTL
ncbi:uncharacterized protein [Antedon mediterranea]|uniref:uncharacterized protein n=1 Tax=Antedon mediterranea TaxID=105859 RepID=UPI003AF501DA